MENNNKVMNCRNEMSNSVHLFIGPLILGLFIVFSACSNRNETFDQNWSNDFAKESSRKSNRLDSKFRGVHVFGGLDSINLNALKANNFEWVTLVTYSHQKDIDSPNLSFQRDNNRRRKNRRDSFWLSQIELAHQKGLKVFLKPHVWVTEPADGKWRSDIFPVNDENWEIWKESYRKFIFHFAELAERGKVDMFCVGAEFTLLTKEKSIFWKELIQDIRKIYSGELTYAANWYNEFDEIEFWNDLDYIGIQAYFPLTDNSYPKANELSKSWDKYLSTLEDLHQKFDKKILFTELGYKSTADGAIRPWEWDENNDGKRKYISPETQANCYQAFFNTIWQKEWFAGVHIWQWRSVYDRENKTSIYDFTPQHKPAIEIIAKGFSRN